MGRTQAGVVMPAFTIPIHEFNKCHNPGGSPAGGEFCSGEGRAGPGERAREIEARILKEATTHAERKHARELAEAEAEIEAGLKAGGDTKTRYFKNGQWTPERQQKHAEILAKYFADAGDLPSGLANPTALILAGLPGAGKSTATKKLDTSDAIVAEADKLKEYLPEYTGSNAPLVQQESSYLANLVAEIALQRRMNVVIDGTMREAGAEGEGVLDGAFGKLRAYQDAGFRTEVILVDVTTDQSIQRIINRFLQTGRYVPPSAVRKSVTKDGTPTPRATFDAVKEARSGFSGVHLVDAWSHYDGWTGERKGGRGTHRWPPKKDES
jgi:hypothetical protein